MKHYNNNFSSFLSLLSCVALSESYPKVIPNNNHSKYPRLLSLVSSILLFHFTSSYNNFLPHSFTLDQLIELPQKVQIFSANQRAIPSEGEDAASALYFIFAKFPSTTFNMTIKGDGGASLSLSLSKLIKCKLKEQRHPRKEQFFRLPHVFFLHFFLSHIHSVESDSRPKTEMRESNLRI